MNREDPAFYWKLARLVPYYGEGVPQHPEWVEQQEESRQIEDLCDRLGLEILSMVSSRRQDFWLVEVQGFEREGGRSLELEVSGEAWWVLATIEDWAREADVDRSDSPYAPLHKRLRAGTRGWN